jgi:hypothetical protein
MDLPARGGSSWLRSGEQWWPLEGDQALEGRVHRIL